MRKIKAPCPGCGMPDLYRSSDKVCEACARLLKQARTINDWIERGGDKKVELVRVPAENCPHFYPGLYMGLPSWSCEDRRPLRAAMVRLINLVSEPLKSDCWHEDGAMLTNPGFKEKWEGARELRSMDAQVAQTIRDLYDAIALALVSTYNGAKREGQNVLLNLAAGHISIDDFNEQQLRKKT